MTVGELIYKSIWFLIGAVASTIYVIYSITAKPAVEVLLLFAADFQRAVRPLFAPLTAALSAVIPALFSDSRRWILLLVSLVIYVLSTIFLVGSGYLALYTLVLRRSEVLSLPVFFDFHRPNETPIAELDLPVENLFKDQAYDFSLGFSVPLSEHNRDLGMFMVSMEIESGAAHDQTLLFSTSRPCLARYSSQLIRSMRSIALSPLLISRLLEEEESFSLQLGEGFALQQAAALKLDSQSAQEKKGEHVDHSTVTARIRLSKELQLYSAQLFLAPQLTGLAYFFHHHFLITSLLIMIILGALSTGIFACIMSIIWHTYVRNSGLVAASSSSSPSSSSFTSSRPSSLSASTSIISSGVISDDSNSIFLPRKKEGKEKEDATAAEDSAEESSVALHEEEVIDDASFSLENPESVGLGLRKRK